MLRAIMYGASGATAPILAVTPALTASSAVAVVRAVEMAVALERRGVAALVTQLAVAVAVRVADITEEMALVAQAVLAHSAVVVAAQTAIATAAARVAVPRAMEFGEGSARAIHHPSLELMSFTV